MPWTACQSPFAWMTRTWSVPSTQAIDIVPSGTWSTPRRSIRLTQPPVSRGGVAPGHDPGIPLGFEHLAQADLGVRERDAGNDWLEEPEDDELPRFVGRDAAALQVEQLALVDRPDGARVGGAAAIGL